MDHRRTRVKTNYETTPNASANFIAPSRLLNKMSHVVMDSINGTMKHTHLSKRYPKAM